VSQRYSDFLMMVGTSSPKHVKKRDR